MCLWALNSIQCWCWTARKSSTLPSLDVKNQSRKEKPPSKRLKISPSPNKNGSDGIKGGVRTSYSTIWSKYRQIKAILELLGLSIQLQIWNSSELVSHFVFVFLLILTITTIQMQKLRCWIYISSNTDTDIDLNSVGIISVCVLIPRYFRFVCHIFCVFSFVCQEFFATRLLFYAIFWGACTSHSKNMAYIF